MGKKVFLRAYFKNTYIIISILFFSPRLSVCFCRGQLCSQRNICIRNWTAPWYQNKKTFYPQSAEQECPRRENSGKQWWNTGWTWSRELPFHHHAIQLNLYCQAWQPSSFTIWGVKFAGLEWCNIIFVHCEVLTWQPVAAHVQYRPWMDIWLTIQQHHIPYFFLQSLVDCHYLPSMDSRVTHQLVDAAPHHLQVSAWY